MHRIFHEKRDLIVLSAILLLGVAVRLIGIDFGLPFKYHDDESFIVNYSLAYGLGDLNPGFMRLPPLLTYILFGTYGIFYLIGMFLGMFPTVRDFSLLFLNDPTLFFIIGRVLLGVLPGVSSIYLIYRLGRKCFSPTAGLLSALFLSVNFLHVRNSHYIYNDIVLTALVIFYFIALLGLFRKEGLKFYLYCGIILGVSVSVKYNAVFLLLPTAAAVFINMLRKRYTVALLFKKAAVFSGSFLLFLFLTNPFMFLDIPAFYKEMSKIGVPLFSPGFWFHLRVSMLGSMGILMVFASVAGMAMAIVKKKMFSVILIFYAVAYYLVLTRGSQTAARYVFPILPVLLLFAAYFIDSVAAGIRGRGSRMTVGAFLTVAVIFYPCLKTYYVDRLFTRKDTRTLAYEWVVSNIPLGERIALDGTGPIYPELKKTKQQIREDLRSYDSEKFPKPAGALNYKVKLMLENSEHDKEAYRLYYMKRETGRKVFFGAYPEIPVDMGALKAQDIKYVVLNRMLREQDAYRGFFAGLEKEAVLVKEFSPYKEGIGRFEPKQSVNEPAAAFSLEELRDRERFGPVLRVYRMEKGQER